MVNLLHLNYASCGVPVSFIQGGLSVPLNCKLKKIRKEKRGGSDLSSGLQAHTLVIALLPDFKSLVILSARQKRYY